MPTSKKRISLAVNDDLYQDFENLKRLKGKSSLAAVVIDLAKEGLEIQEDLYFAKIADERENEASISHEQFWRKS